MIKHIYHKIVFYFRLLCIIIPVFHINILYYIPTIKHLLITIKHSSSSKYEKRVYHV